MGTVFSIINSYSNLILVLITSVYVFLTWKMAAEMKKTRELQDDSLLVAALFPYGVELARLKIINVGNAPALKVRAVVKLSTDIGNNSLIWEHPVLLSGEHEKFRLPGSSESIKEIANHLGKLVVELKWENLLGKSRSRIVTFDIEDLRKGWFESRFIVPTEEIPVQLQRIKDELSRLNDRLQKQENLRMLQDLDEATDVDKKPIKKKRKT